jgi:phosphoesterase RecJ-like protein
MKINWNKLTKVISESNNILLSTHINPDGDGLGSEVAMYYYIKSLNKNCRIINISDLTDKYEFLNKNNIIEKFNKTSHESWISSCDCAIIFDIGNYTRLGQIAKILNDNSVTCISIDHHPSEDSFFDFRCLDISAPATGYLVWQYLKIIDYDLTYDMAEGLYAALITDTGSFRYNSTTPDCHVMAKEILEAGIKPYDVYSSIYEQRTLPQVKLLGAVIDSLRIVDEFAIIRITIEMLKDCDATLEDVDGFTDFMRSMKGVEVSFMISQINDNKFRINFRSRGKYIINDIAAHFNGGGHKLAAGATIENSSFDEIENIIIKMLNKKKESLCR